MKLHKFGAVVFVAALFLISCNGTSLELAPLDQNKTNPKSDDTPYSLDLSKPEIEQPIKPGDTKVAGVKFVQVEVTQVTNPQNRPAQFEVRYQPNDGEKILLGSFSLYPPNNPGKFIVPTQGKVRGGGKLILTLVKSDQVVAGDVVRVEVKTLKFVNDIEH